MTRALAKELGNDDITVNTISPGYILTEGNLTNAAFAAVHREAAIASRAARNLYEADLALTRPDQIVAWRDNSDAAVIVRRVLSWAP